MTYRTHVLGGTASVWVLATMPGGLDAIGLSCVFAVLGSLLPDLDAGSSKLQSLSVKGIRPFVPVGWLVRGIVGHRGPLHSWMALYAVTMLVSLPFGAYAGWQAATALSLGYASHLLLDMCTVTGLRVWWPFSLRTFWLPPKWLRVVTNGEWEGVYTMALGALTLGLLVSMLSV